MVRVTQRPASTDPLVIGILAGELTIAASGEAPEWIKVTPRGRVQTRDGRSYAFDPEALVRRFTADAVDVPADRNHAIALLGARGEDADAIGWAKALEARADGTYARMEWLDAGKATLAARTHRYVSPSVPADAEGNAVWIHSISLVAAPAMSMPAIFHALGYPESPMKQIAKALGLPETADEAACLAALNGRPAPALLAAALNLPETTAAPALLTAAGAARAALRDVAKKLGLAELADAPSCLAAIETLQKAGGGNETIATLQGQLTATTALVTEMRSTARTRDVNELLEGALESRKIAPAQREHFAKLCATDDGLTNVRAMLAATVPGLQPSGLDDRRPSEGGGDAVDPVTLSAAAQKLQDERRTAGMPISFSEAVALAAKKPPTAA